MWKLKSLFALLRFDSQLCSCAEQISVVASVTLCELTSSKYLETTALASVSLTVPLDAGMLALDIMVGKSEAAGADADEAWLVEDDVGRLAEGFLSSLLV